MKTQPTYFHSDGYKLDAAFYWPDKKSVAKNKPIIIVCSGFTGLKHIHPERFARLLTTYGNPCFAFDYRGFHKSEGVRKNVLIEDQIADIVHALSFVSTHKDVSDRPIVLMGWGMGGGLIIEATRLFPKVAALVAVNGFYNALRVQKSLRGEEKYREFQEWLAHERALAATTGVLPEVDPFKVYPLDPVSEVYVNTYLRAADGYNESAAVRLNFADSLLKFQPERHLDHLANTPIFIGHGDCNALHPVEEAVELYDQYPGPKKLYWVEKAGHTEWMHDDNPSLQALVLEVNLWITDQLPQIEDGQKTAGTFMSTPHQASSSAGAQPKI